MITRKKDQAEIETDKLLTKLEKRISTEYSAALKEVKEKYNRFVLEFTDADIEKQKQVKAGKITKEAYLKWRTNKIFTSERYVELAKVLAEDLTKANQKAMSIANGYMPEAYAMNFNYSTYEIEQGTNVNTAFTLYSRETVEKLVKDGSITLPKRKVDIPKDERWNRKHINSAILQGVLQGDSIPKIADRLQQVTDMNRKAAVRNARTMMTGAQNGGRIDAYERASNLGIRIQKEWMATLDTRTRDSHQRLDGERVDWNKKFSNKLLYPGDPKGDPAEVYNCRCTLVPFYPDYADLISDRMTYSEWLKSRQDADSTQDVQDVQEQEKLFDVSKIQHSSGARDLLNALNTRKVAYNEVQKWDKQPTEEEIIKRLAGGDMTAGSCMSLACAYAGNKHGLNVLDFRGTTSCDVFSLAHRYLIKTSAFEKNTILQKGSTTKPTKELLKNVEKGKEYILITGRHAAVVRKDEQGRLQYLELQSSTENGWKNFDRNYVMYKGWAGYERTVHLTMSDTLKNRFGCNKGSAQWGLSSLTDITDFNADDEFREILGYINTDPGKQKKGVSGDVK